MIWNWLSYRPFLESGETVQFVYRQPFGPIFMRIIFWTLLTAAGVYGSWFFLPYPLSLLWGAILGIGSIRVIWIIRSWRMRALLVTNLGVSFLDWERFFYRQIYRLEYHIIDNIQLEQLGAQQVLFNFGTIKFQSMAGGNFSIDRVASPKSLIHKIESAREKFLHQQGRQDENNLRELLVRLAKQDNRKNDGSGTNASQPKAETPKKRWEESSILVEKKLDDHGGIAFDLEENDSK